MAKTRKIVSKTGRSETNVTFPAILTGIIGAVLVSSSTKIWSIAVADYNGYALIYDDVKFI